MKKNPPKSKDLLTGGAPLKEPLKRAPTGPQDLAIGRGPRRKPSIDHYRGLGSEGLFVRAPADGEVWRLGGRESGDFNTGREHKKIEIKNKVPLGGG